MVIPQNRSKKVSKDVTLEDAAKEAERQKKEKELARKVEAKRIVDAKKADVKAKKVSKDVTLEDAAKEAERQKKEKELARKVEDKRIADAKQADEKAKKAADKIRKQQKLEAKKQEAERKKMEQLLNNQMLGEIDYQQSELHENLLIGSYNLGGKLYKGFFSYPRKTALLRTQVYDEELEIGIRGFVTESEFEKIELNIEKGNFDKLNRQLVKRQLLLLAQGRRVRIK